MSVLTLDISPPLAIAETTPSNNTPEAAVFSVLAKDLYASLGITWSGILIPKDGAIKLAVSETVLTIASLNITSI